MTLLSVLLLSSLASRSLVLPTERRAELMKQIPCFTERKTLVNNMGKLFLVTRRVSVDLDDDPNISFVARLLFSTLESIVSRILPMQDYRTIEMAEVVSLFPLLFMVP